MDDKKKTQLQKDLSQYDLPFKEHNLNDKKEVDEIESDGSASAFDETESVNEDNFDDLSEK